MALNGAVCTYLQHALRTFTVIHFSNILLADEPTAALDSKSGRDVVELMHGLGKEQGCAILMVTHDNRILDGEQSIWKMVNQSFVVKIEV